MSSNDVSETRPRVLFVYYSHTKQAQRVCDAMAEVLRDVHRLGQRTAADLACRLQPGGERELPGLAGKGARQKPILDLRRQRQRNRALPPLE
jgi:hypothetical protein